MHGLRRDLPSLTSLVAFESAARRESFTRAAAELNVTQAAVSRRIKALETDLGRPLFERSHRRVRLTEAGRRLFEAVTRGFDGIAETVAALPMTGERLTVAASIAFGHFRLLPALSAFRDAHPDVELRVLTEDAWSAPDDGQVDVAIRYGRPPFRGMRVAGALPETIAPVAAPALAARLGALDPGALARPAGFSLIESASPEPSWIGWPRWLARAGWSGAVAEARLRFSSYSDAAYAAMDGQGVALGWTSLLERPLGDGRLALLDIAAMIPEEKHYLLVPEHRPQSADATSFVAWMERTFTRARGAGEPEGNAA
ncbi:DNA-binding transcriptional LysR family regulator [Palleronia aestuarii]|uniref:DNA-binding transcriptional LysR family regulator n=1 Tax=Palleronia aestuarii TaxID=568105 RepID=A0A2W7N252_9RHOB|nr:LysR substrate-binding domain-containing protein [Palleronia aestuarii]PZX14505.1 DNA-binding transcriptional LysR family regulator [Palleronia aestuarii]